MIGYLTGNIKSKNNNSCVILTSTGVGYKVFLPLNAVEKMKVGESVECFIHTHVREDQLSLFGFLREQDLNVFELLITVSGVGPKTAMNIFGAGDGERIAGAIAQKNKLFFKGVSGLGTKTTEKIFLELKGKVSSWQSADGRGEGITSNMEEAYSALQNLGYQNREILDYFRRNKGIENEKVEEIVKGFLKK